MSSHKSIFKTSLITGGSQFIVLILNLIKAKFFAVILGSAGTGLIGIFTSTTDLIFSISSMGLNSSAIRQIAKQNKLDDKTDLQKTLFVYRWLIRITGLIGALSLFFLSSYFSQKAFGNDSFSIHFQILSCIVLLSSFSSGQYGLLQGLRKIKELALAKTIGAFVGTIGGVLLVYFFKEKAIIPIIILGSVTLFIASSYFTNKQHLKSVKVNAKEFKTISVQLLKVGFAFLMSSLTISASAYFSRIIIAEQFSITYIGIYTACWTLSSVYINFILNAMSADFYPRLSEIIEDKKASTQLVNNQIEIGLLMAITGIVGVLSFSEFVLTVFYSNKFSSGSNLLQWMTLGMVLKVYSWPFGFVIISKGKMKIFALLELTWGVIYILSLKITMLFFGFNGVGIAFFSAYFIYSIIVYFIAKKIIHFTWTKSNLYTLLLISLALILSLLFNHLPNILLSTFFACVLLIITFTAVYIRLSNLMNVNLIKLLKNKLNKKR